MYAYNYFIKEVAQSLSFWGFNSSHLGSLQLFISIIISSLLYIAQLQYAQWIFGQALFSAFLCWGLTGLFCLLMIVFDDSSKYLLSNFLVENKSIVRYSQLQFRNEIFNRISDSIIFISIGYSVDDIELGCVTATVSIFNSYLRSLRRSVGIKNRHSMGPFNRRQRLLVIGANLLFHAVASLWLYPQIGNSTVIGLVYICFWGTVITSVFRVIVLYLELEVEGLTASGATVQFNHTGTNGKNLSRLLLGASIGYGLYNTFTAAALNYALPIDPISDDPPAFESNRSTVVFQISIVLLFITSLVCWTGKYLRSNSKFWESFDLKTRTWWVLILLFFSLSLKFERNGVFFFFGFCSYLGLKEYLSMVETRTTDRRVLLIVYLSLPLHYFFIVVRWESMFIVFIPIYMVILTASRMVLTGETNGFLKAVSVLHWGLFMTVYCLSHLPALLNLPIIQNSPDGMFGLLVYVIYLTEWNDIFHFFIHGFIGHKFPTNQILPTISTSRKYVTVIPSIVLTVGLSYYLGGYITPFDSYLLGFFGLLISVLGVLGNLVSSAIKQELGIVSTGSLLPGHGGIIDRFTSLFFVAPIFFHVVRYWEDF